MPVGAGAIWRGAGCFPDHGNRSAAGSGIGARGDQYGAQPGLERYQPGAGVRRSEDRAVQARGRDRDAEGAGGDGAAEAAGGGAGGTVPRRSGCSQRLPAEHTAEALREGARRLSGGAEISMPTIIAALITFVALLFGMPILL